MHKYVGVGNIYTLPRVKVASKGVKPMRKIVKTFLPVLLLLLFTIQAGAALIDEAFVSDIENNIISVSGSLPGKLSNRLVTVFLLKNGETSGKNDQMDNVEYMDVALVSYEGSYSLRFGFSGESGIYTVRVFNGSEYAEAEIEFYNIIEVREFVRQIGEGLLSSSELIRGLQKYSQSLGVDMSKFNTQSLKNLLVKRINGAAKNIKEQGIAAIQAVFEAATLEAKLLDDIKNAESWYEIYRILSETTDITGIDFTDYNKLNSKSDVCVPILRASFADADELKRRFNELVTAALSAQKSGGTKSPGGSGGSSGGGSRVFTSEFLEVTAVEPKVPAKASFDDIEAVPWAQEAIEFLYREGVINGVGENKFSPNTAVKREEFVKMVVNAFSLYDESATADFLDTKVGDWHYPYISSAKKAGLVSGKGGNIFGVGDFITRQEMAVILYRIADLKNVTFEIQKRDFNDFDLVSEYARDAVAYLYGSGIISGMGDGIFAPSELATRAQAATLVYNFMKEVDNHE